MCVWGLNQRVGSNQGVGSNQSYILPDVQEMRKRRGASPYGHTQQLSIAWPRGVTLSRARMLAAQVCVWGGPRPRTLFSPNPTLCMHSK